MPRRRRITEAQLQELYGSDVGAIEQVAAFLDMEPLHAEGELGKFLLAARSSTEAKFRLFLRNIVETHTKRKALVILHEWHTFNLPGGSYTPDWCVLLDSGQWLYIENKGSTKQTNYRDARAKLRAAASLNPWSLFFEARPPIKKANKQEIGHIVNGWVFEPIQPDPSFLANVLTYFEDRETSTRVITEREPA